LSYALSNGHYVNAAAMPGQGRSTAGKLSTDCGLLRVSHYSPPRATPFGNEIPIVLISVTAMPVTSLIPSPIRRAGSSRQKNDPSLAITESAHVRHPLSAGLNGQKTTPSWPSTHTPRKKYPITVLSIHINAHCDAYCRMNAESILTGSE
jgi:hypothetical protein